MVMERHSTWWDFLKNLLHNFYTAWIKPIINWLFGSADPKNTYEHASKKDCAKRQADLQNKTVQALAPELGFKPLKQSKTCQYSKLTSSYVIKHNDLSNSKVTMTGHDLQCKPS